jgi:hypothetical protein
MVIHVHTLNKIIATVDELMGEMAGNSTRGQQSSDLAVTLLSRSMHLISNGPHEEIIVQIINSKQIETHPIETTHHHHSNQSPRGKMKQKPLLHYF